jgi:hypothetical protein
VIPECKKRIHFRTDMEHYICRPVNNSDVSLGYQFCKNITFILYIIYMSIPHILITITRLIWLDNG